MLPASPPLPDALPDALPVLEAVRYVTPLREGGSLPAVVEVEGGALFVAKFRGAGQGARALVAELIVGSLAEVLGLPLPPLALLRVAEPFGRSEPDPEIQDILRGSRGLNVGLGFVEGAFGYDPLAAADLVPPALAAAVVWLDALTTNIDRTARNPNLLVARPDGGRPALWLIDHGAALYFHHNWATVDEARARAPFAPIREHVLLPRAASVLEADARLAPRLTEAAIGAVLARVPDALLVHAPEGQAPPFETAAEARNAYARFFRARLEAPRAFAQAAEQARRALPDAPPEALPYRR
ncbi:MAG: HipA family kinase [Rubricoccaceae bacterium]